MNKRKIGALLCGIFIANFIGSSATITVKAKDKVDDFKEEYVNLRRTAWYKNYQIWAAILLVLSAFIWIIF